VLGTSEPPRRDDITIRVPTEPGSHPDQAAFAITASHAAAARDASLLARTRLRRSSASSAVTGPEAAAVALAIVADALKADRKAAPSPSR